MLRGRKAMLRPIERSDLPRIHLFVNHLDIALLSNAEAPSPRSLASLEAGLQNGQVTDERTYAEFAIEANGLCIGYCGLYRTNSSARVCEVGVVIGDTEYQGKGYGGDILRLLLDYAFRLSNLNRVWAGIHANNLRSLRMCRGLGFREEGVLRSHRWVDGSYVDLIVLGILAEEWNSSKHAARMALPARPAAKE